MMLAAAERAAPTWSELRRFGESRVLKSSYIWFLIVPLAANIVQRFNEGPVWWWTAIGGHKLALPFSWQLFFFSAVFVAFASLTYEVGCPRIIKVFRDWRELQASAASQRQILSWFAEILTRGAVHHGGRWQEWCRRIIHDRILEHSVNGREVIAMLAAQELSPIRVQAILLAVEVDDNQARELAALLWEVAELNLAQMRVLCCAGYALGGLCAAVVVMQNIITVARTITW